VCASVSEGVCGCCSVSPSWALQIAHALLSSFLCANKSFTHLRSSGLARAIPLREFYDLMMSVLPEVHARLRGIK
jgi:hypothetical protein